MKKFLITMFLLALSAAAGTGTVAYDRATGAVTKPLSSDVEANVLDLEAGTTIGGVAISTSTSSGNVVGPGVSVATAIALFANTSGELMLNSVLLVDASGNVTGVGTVDGRDISADGLVLDIAVLDTDIGTTVQAYDADLDDLADGTLSASKIDAAITRDTEWDTFAELNAILGLDADIATLTLEASTTISSYIRTLLDDTSQGAARTSLGVDPAGTDNSTDVSLTGLGYIVNSGSQNLTLQAVNLTTDVTAVLPAGNLPTGDDDGSTLGVVALNDTDFNATAGVVTLARGEYDYWELGAGLFSTQTTAGAEWENEEKATHDVQVDHYNFDAAADEGIWCQFPTPDDWDGGTIKVKIYWDSTGTGNVMWSVSARCLGDSDAIDQAPAGEQGVTEAKDGTTGDIHITAATAAITVQGTPAGGEMIMIRITRDADNGSDTLNADGEFYGALVQYRKGTSAGAAW